MPQYARRCGRKSIVKHGAWKMKTLVQIAYVIVKPVKLVMYQQLTKQVIYIGRLMGVKNIAVIIPAMF